MLFSRLVLVSTVTFLFTILSSGSVFAGTSMYGGSWIAESFGNDKVGIGTEASQYFSVFGMPMGVQCHGGAPLCDFSSTPVTTTGTSLSPGANGTAWAPLGPGCRLLTVSEKPRPAKGGTSPPRTPPLYRNPDHFTVGGAAFDQTCQATTTVGGSPATAFLAPGDPNRGIAQKGRPVQGFATATTTGTAFKLPVAPASPGPGDGMFRTARGSFAGTPPYLYSYTYATLRNDAGSFGNGKGFFSPAAATSTLMFQNKAGSTVASVKVTRGTNRFGGVMKLLGSLTTKVCYFYAGGCGLGYGTWDYQDIGAAGYKDSKAGSPVVTASFTDTTPFTYYNTALATTAKYNRIAQRFPWTTGTVTVTATGRGPHKTFEVRNGFDSRVSGIGTVQLVSPILTQWIAQGSGPKFETGGIAVMQVKFVPEATVNMGLVAGLALLVVMHRFRK